jgi:acetyl/propionyl-CoA carboxylase alpha subunit
VRECEGLRHALESARREAMNAFGDDRIYLEKLIEHPHHIEFQVFGDKYGNAVHLFERECSVQRRHQKIVEETPSPLLDAALRGRMGEAAVAAVKAANYVNAGTLEFLVDAQRNFYFLEMNTRLQVEHPVTELVTGIDLVKLQLRIAAGEPLPFRQEELRQRGHAIECRIYAEDPANQFLPAIGKVLLAVEPVGPGVRVDAGVTTGDEVTLHYDPMIAKLVVLGEDRADAIGRMQWALGHYVVLGDVITNIAFLRDVLAHPRFMAGDTTTDFVEQALAGWQPPRGDAPDLALAAAALAEVLAEGPAAGGSGAAAATAGDPFNPWQTASGFRLGGG